MTPVASLVPNQAANFIAPQAAFLGLRRYFLVL